MSYTEGTWTAVKMPTSYQVCVDVDIMGETDNGIVADVYSCFTGVAEANARLISSDPLMYKALKLYQSHQQGTHGHYCWECAEAIEQALAKAEGK